MNIRAYGTDARLGFCREYLLNENITGVREIILLPIPTSRDGKTLTGLEKSPEELLRGDFSGAVAVGYEIPRAFREYFSGLGISVADVSLDEDFLLENAALTAVGAVGKILSEYSAAPSELSLGVVGYGRIGKRLLNILAFLGADLTVFTTKKAVAEELCMEGISGVCLSDTRGEELSGILSHIDVLINTAPSEIFTSEVLEAFGGEILELASGNNFPSGVKVTRLAALPAKMYPKSAGKALAASVVRMIG